MPIKGLSKNAARQWGKAKLVPNSSFMPASADFQVGSKLLSFSSAYFSHLFGFFLSS